MGRGRRAPAPPSRRPPRRAPSPASTAPPAPAGAGPARRRSGTPPRPWRHSRRGGRTTRGGRWSRRVMRRPGRVDGRGQREQRQHHQRCRTGARRPPRRRQPSPRRGTGVAASVSTKDSPQASAATASHVIGNARRSRRSGRTEQRRHRCHQPQERDDQERPEPAPGRRLHAGDRLHQVGAGGGAGSPTPVARPKRPSSKSLTVIRAPFRGGAAVAVPGRRCRSSWRAAGARHVGAVGPELDGPRRRPGDLGRLRGLRPWTLVSSRLHADSRADAPAPPARRRWLRDRCRPRAPPPLPTAPPSARCPHLAVAWSTAPGSACACAARPGGAVGDRVDPGDRVGAAHVRVSGLVHLQERQLQHVLGGGLPPPAGRAVGQDPRRQQPVQLVEGAARRRSSAPSRRRRSALRRPGSRAPFS